MLDKLRRSPNRVRLPPASSHRFHVDAYRHANVGVDDRLNAGPETLGQIITLWLVTLLQPSVLTMPSWRPAPSMMWPPNAVQASSQSQFYRCSANDDVAQTGVQVALDGVQVRMPPPSCIIDFQPNFGKNLLDRHLIFAASARSTVGAGA
jgi:hypothetical protein